MYTIKCVKTLPALPNIFRTNTVDTGGRGVAAHPRPRALPAVPAAGAPRGRLPGTGGRGREALQFERALEGGEEC